MKKPPNFHRVIFDTLDEGMYSVDKDLRITSFNKAAEEITGFTKDQVLGKFCKVVFKSSQCKSGCPLAYALELNESVKDQHVDYKDVNNKNLPLKVNASIFRDDKNNPVGGVVLFRTINDFSLVKKGILKRMEFEGIIGQNKKMQEIYTLIEEISQSKSGVLIQGESGTGKELIANAIQRTSMRKEMPYIKVNCSVFPHELLASELFGHVKGAFTDANRDRVGRFELANNGTIFLDEIAEADQRVQIQLLRVLQEGTFERIGESITRSVDVRVISATNLDIEKAIKEGKFREDLFYRLNVIPIVVPPLRERKDDIPLLLEYLLKKYSLLTSKKISEIDDESMEVFMEYDWPGNVRELENVIEYTFSRTKSSKIIYEKLPPNLKNLQLKIKSARGRSKIINEEEHIRKVLEELKWNRTQAAEKLGIGRATLWRKMKAYNLLDN